MQSVGGADTKCPVPVAVIGDTKWDDAVFHPRIVQLPVVTT
jgi:hypothetical protein